MKNRILLSLTLLLIPIFSFAHGSHGSGFMAGFTHPLFGFDHNFAILGIGILGACIDKVKWYIYPLAFLGFMIIGGAFGIEQEASTLIEKIIAASVIIVGILLSFDLSKSRIIVLILLSIFGYFHGFAHGAEMPETTTIVKYISGYSAGTILIAFVGYLFYRLISTLKNPESLLKIIGGFMIGAGTVFLLG